MIPFLRKSAAPIDFLPPMLAPSPKAHEGGAEATPRGAGAEARGALSPLHPNPLMTPARDRAGITSPLVKPNPNLSACRMRRLLEQRRRAFSSGGGRGRGLHLEFDDHTTNSLRGTKRQRLDNRTRTETQPTDESTHILPPIPP